MYRFEFSNVRVEEKYDVVTGILKKNFIDPTSIIQYLMQNKKGTKEI